MSSRKSQMTKFPGGHRGRVTPVPIPNTEVKPATADGTACAGVWESRSLPGVISRARLTISGGLFFSLAFRIPPRRADTHGRRLTIRCCNGRDVSQIQYRSCRRALFTHSNVDSRRGVLHLGRDVY